MRPSRFETGFQANTPPKVFSLTTAKTWRLKVRYLFVFVGLILLSLHLSSLMAKNDAMPNMWTPPVEPPGAVIVTSNSFKAAQPQLTPAQPVDVVSKVPVAGHPSATKNLVPAAEDLIAALDSWSNAWKSQDMGTYLGAYAPSFVPAKGISREAWAKLRTARITGKQNIRHEVRDVNVKLSENKAVVKFTQFYADERLQQTEQKTMHWVLSDGRWLIAREVAH